MSIKDGWITSAEMIPSPNFFSITDREISLLVIHNISLPPNSYGGHYVDQLFTNQLDSNAHPYFSTISHLRVSSHLLITRSGQLKQYVPFQACAHHAGQSSFMGRSNCNEYSIGIELEGSDFEPFVDVQYELLAAVTKILLVEFPRIEKDRIVGHSDIAAGRKTDHGPFFDWSRYKKLLD